MSLLRNGIPGGLLTQLGGLLTAGQALVIQAITSGTYFVFNEIPSGTIDGNNKTFTLANTPSPLLSLEVYLNGQYLKSGGEDYTLTSNSIVFVIAPSSGSNLLCNYTVSPV